MATTEFESEPNPTDIEEFIDRLQPAGVLERDITASQVLIYDSDSETLSIDFEKLKRVLLEHQQYQQAKGFSHTAMDILRVLEEGPDRMRFDEIRSDLNIYYEENGQETLADQTFQHYLRDLREKGLVEHAHNSYTYVGP